MSDMGLSVVMPLYNKASYVVQALRSLQAQHPQPDEVIVVDDGSTDDGPAHVQSLRWDRVTLLRQPNAGVSAARNRGLAHARSELVSFLDADDLYCPQHVANMRRLAIDHPDAGLLCCAYLTRDAKGQTSEMRMPGWAPGQRGLVPDFFRVWRRLSFTFTSAITVRRSHLAGLGTPFPVGERLGEDQDLWFRLAEAGPVAYANDCLSIYRVDVPDSATHGNAPLDLLPCYRRLAQRVELGQVPAHLRRSAAALVATHWINTARARWHSNDRRGAWALMRGHHVWARPAYVAQTLAGWAGLPV